MSDKITPQHKQRTAYVYVRQSCAHQVRHHLEGQRRQYALAERAKSMGFARTVVIDEDQGRSGSGLTHRPGFGQLLSAVCASQAGAVFALEASRLARNNRDWHHLVDLCAMTETLLIDDEGVYDPRQLNDRLLLGLKGTMSEFELGLFRQRARQAFEQKVQRGHAMWEVPVGFVRNEDDRMRRLRTCRFKRPSRVCSVSSGNWRVLGRRPCGIATRMCLCPWSSPAARAETSSGDYPVDIASIRS